MIKLIATICAGFMLYGITPGGSTEAKPQQWTTQNVVVFNRYVHGQIGWTY